MTTETKTNSCTNCGDPVVVRRPSASGLHFCGRKECKAAKQRAHYRARIDRRSQAALAAALEELRLALFRSVIGEEWTTDGCPECSQMPVLDGWVHPKPGWTEACRGVGIAGDNEQGILPYLKVIWPEGCPF